MRFFRRSQPTPPTNVRLNYPDGRTVPVECVYDGKDGDGIHGWRMVFPEALDPELVAGRLSISVEILPAKTALYFPIRNETRAGTG